VTAHELNSPLPALLSNATVAAPVFSLYLIITPYIQFTGDAMLAIRIRWPKPKAFRLLARMRDMLPLLPTARFVVDVVAGL
jgi:hypothetical protein